MMRILGLIAGGALLLLGRRLFWLFVAGAGFAVAWQLVPDVLHVQSQLLLIGISLFAGLIGALLAIFLQQFAILLAGFFAGGYFVLTLLGIFGVTMGRFNWVPFIIGGIMGALLVAALFQWALIILSSLAGASLIVQSIRLEPTMELIVLIGLFIVGLVVQATSMRGERTRESTRYV
jgi:hypothetical protein